MYMIVHKNSYLIVLSGTYWSLPSSILCRMMLGKDQHVPNAA